MSLSRLTLLLAVAIIAVPIHAQVGIYGKSDVTHFSVPSNNFESTATYYGPGAGIYYDFLHLGPVSLGADLRGDFLYSNGQKYRSVLGGLRLAVKVPATPIRPYVQGSVGDGGPSHSGLNGSGTIYSNKFQYEVLGGLDVSIFPHVEWRVAEFGYGRVSGISSGAPAPKGSLVFGGTGIVVRLP